VGSDSWLAELFRTGANPGGYLLNSIQLALTDATGNPSAFTAMIYNQSPFLGAIEPGSSIASLSGSLTPVAAGTYTYSPASNLTLSPSTYYFIVLTAGTPVASAAYEWSTTSTDAPTLSNGWEGGGDLLSSSDGLARNWDELLSTYPLFAISGTPVPEPSVLGLLVLGGFFLVWHRRKAKAI